MGSAFSMSWGDGGTPTTLGHLLGGFAEDSVARTSGVLGAGRENLARGEETTQLRCLLDHRRALLLNVNFPL